MTLDLGDNYSDPYVDTQRQTTDLKESLLNTAKSMALLIGLNMVGGAVWRALSSTGAAAIRRYGTGKLATLAKMPGSNTLGGMLKNTSAIRELTQSFNSATRIFKKSLDIRSMQIKRAAIKGPMHAAVARIKTAFRDVPTFTATVARAAYNTGVVGSAVSYAIDVGLGYGESVYGLEKKEWYDIPGKMANFGKWMIMNTISGLSFNVMTKGLAALGAAGGLQVAKVFRGQFGKDLSNFIFRFRRGMPDGFGSNNILSSTFRDEIFNWSLNVKDSLAARTAYRAMTLTRNAGAITKAFNDAIIDSVVRLKESFKKSEPINKIEYVSGPIKEALQQIKDIWHLNRERHKEYSHASHPGLAAVELINVLAEKNSNAIKSNAAGFIDSLKLLAKKDKRTTLLDEIFGLQPLRIKDIVKPTWEREKREIFRERLFDGQGDLLMDHVLNMRVGPGYYKAHGTGIKGGGVDLSIFDPLASVRRAVTALLLQPIRLPLLRLNINIGDIFGLNTWASESPPVTFWSDRRSYKLGKAAAERAEGMGIFPKRAVSTAEVSPDVWLTAYIDGKLNFFTEAGEIHTLDWNRRLMFDYQHGARRGNENAWMKNAARTRDQARQPGEHKYNKWLYNWLFESELTFPGFFKSTLSRINARLKGKNIEYKSLGHILSTSQDIQDFERYRNVFAALRQQSGQEIYHILTRKGALDTIAEVNHLSQFGDLYETLLSSRALHARLNDLMVDHDFVSKRGLLEDISHLKAFPTKGRHVTVKGIGLSKELTLEDQIRLEIVDDFFGKIWTQRGQGADHPLVRAIPELKKRGYINEKQEQSLKVFATLSPFVNTGILSKSKIDKFKFMDLVREARRSLENTNHDIHKDILDYVSSRSLRTISIDDKITDSIFKAPTYNHLNNASPYISVSYRPFECFFEDTLGGIAQSVTDMMAHLVVPFKKDPTKHSGLKGSLRYLTSSIVKIGIANFAFKALDASLAANPMLDDTALEAGITGAFAEIAAHGRLFTSRVFDALGVTSVAKYLNGLMPGFVTAAPGAIIGAVVSRTMGGGPQSMLKGFMYGAIGNRILAPLLPDFTKTYDQLYDEYSGKTTVPIMKSAFWLFGRTPWEGQKVEGYSPNWYIRAKSRWQETDTLYGSIFRRLLHEPIFPLGISIGDFIDPYYMERKHYFSRPYPLTGRFGEEIPLIGPLIAGTVGKLIKPQKTMHQEFLSGGDESGASDTYPFAYPPPTLQEGLGMMQHSWGIDTMRGRSSLFGTFKYSPPRPYSYAMAEEFLYNVQNFSGLKGFVAGAVSERIFPRSIVLPTLETAGRIASQARFYGDANLGGLGIFCLPSSEKVLTIDGLKEIKDIKIGDIVFDKDFSEQKVLNVFSRLTYKNEKLYTITIGAGNTKIKTTENHPWAIYSRKNCINNKNRPCIPGYSSKCMRCSCKDNRINFRWIPAKDIKVGDFIVQPLPKVSKEIIVDFGLFASDKNGLTDNYIYYGSSEFGKAYELLENQTCKDLKELKKYINHPAIKEALLAYKTKRRIRRIKRYHKIDNEFAYLIGWWLAEGTSDIKTGNITFTINIKEEFIAKVLQKIILDKFSLQSTIVLYNDKNTCKLLFKSKILARFFKQYGNVYSKQLKNLINLPDEQACYLLDGLINGDGWLNYKLNCGGFTSVSSKLVRDVWLLCYRLGIQSTITIDHIENSAGFYPQGTKRKPTRRSYLKFNHDGFNNLITVLKNKKGNGNVSNGRCFTHNGTLYIKIVDVKSQDYSYQVVYDIEVENTHCFIGNYALLHNSEPIRRIIQKRDSRRFGINPIPNMMPDWLPSEFLTGDPYCLSGDTYIEVNKNNIKRIDEYNGELITTHVGKYKYPIAFRKREMDKNEKLFLIKVSSLEAFPIKATEDHPFLTIRGWVKAVDLNIGDYVGYPIPKIEDLTISDSVIDLAKYTNKQRDSKFIYSTNSKRTRTALKNNTTQRIPRFINQSKEFNSIIGYYLSAGFIIYSNKKRVGLGFAFDSDEFDCHKELEACLYEVFNIRTTKKINGTTCIIYLNNTALAQIFSNMFGEGSTKELRNIPCQYVKDTLRVLINRDGSYHLNRHGSILSLKLEGHQLLYQVRKLLLTFGFVGYATENCLKLIGPQAKECITFLQTRYKWINDLNSTCKDTYIENGYVWMRIFEKKEVPQEPVFGMEVQGDNSFCTAGVATHNSKIIRGELRLPGKAYESTHATINKSMPARASMFGGPLEHIVQYFTGLLPPNLKEEYDILESGTNIHRQIQDQLAAEGLLIQAEKLVYDVKNDISGHVDAIIRDGTGGGGKRALEIKTINEAAFAKLEGPKYQHVGQLNFYLKQLNLKEGEILYVNRDNPAQVKLFRVNYSESRYQRDIEKLNKARQIAIDVMNDGVGDRFGYTYSWLDRLEILADVAPLSDEYKEAKAIVEEQIRANILTEDEVARYKRALKHKKARIRKYELYPYRFKGKIFSPDSEANIQSINEDIKASSEYTLPERMIGAAWEAFTNSNNYISNKFFAFKDPLEHYKQLKLYGREYTPWDDPWGSFVEPTMRNILSKTNPIGGAYKAGIVGYIIGGGPVGAIVGGLLGAAYGTVNGAVRLTTDSVYIPGEIQTQREINRFFDVAKYERYSRAAQLSEGLTRQEYMDAANATLNAYNESGTSIGELFKATPYMEKPYISAWLEENDPKRRKEILKYIDPELAKALKRTWATNDDKRRTNEYIKNTSAILGSNRPGFDRSILDPSVFLEDIKLKTINEAGLKAHDFGLGWNEQLARIQQNYNEIGYVTPREIEEFEQTKYTPDLSPTHVKYLITEYLRNNGIQGRANVYINNGADDVNVINVTIKRDKARSILSALENRSKYLE